MADPPVLGAVKAIEIDPLPAVAVPMVGAAGGVLYCRAAGLDNEPLLLGVSATGPTAVGVMVNVCAADELLNVSTMGALSAPPEGVIVIVPLYTESGVTVKEPDAAPIAPPAGPVKVKLVAGAYGVAEFEAAEA